MNLPVFMREVKSDLLPATLVITHLHQRLHAD